MRRTLLSQAVVTPEWVRAQTINLMNQADLGGDGIDEAEFADLEGAKVRLLPNLRTATNAERDAAPSVDFKTLLPKAAPAPSSSTPLADRLATWLQIRQSFLDEKLVEKPATLSYSTADDSDETVEAGARRNQWSIAAAVVLRAPKWVKTTTHWEVYPVAAYEAALSSGLKKDMNSLTHRGGLVGSWLNGAATMAHGFSATFDYNTDRSYDSTVLGGTFQYTAGVPGAAIGKFVGGKVAVTWRPYVGFTFGDVVDQGERADLTDRVDFSDLYARIGSKLLLTTHAAVISEVSLFHQLRGTEQTYGLAESSFNLYITPENSKTPVSLQVSGTVGRKSPAFKKQQIAKVALAFKF